MWNSFKDLIRTSTGLSDPTLHALLGAAIFLALFAITRRPWLSFAILICMQFANEAFDAVEDWINFGDVDVSAFFGDTLITVALPVFLAAIFYAMRRSRNI